MTTAGPNLAAKRTRRSKPHEVLLLSLRQEREIDGRCRRCRQPARGSGEPASPGAVCHPAGTGKRARPASIRLQNLSPGHGSEAQEPGDVLEATARTGRQWYPDRPGIERYRAAVRARWLAEGSVGAA